ncbi:MAG: 50S ribosomal protein L24 [bacterium]|nr:50S ribosomal protein L24 [bacterium]
MARIRKNDQVMVTGGKDKGKMGRVLLIDKDGKRVLVEKVNMVKKHMKPTQKNPQGGVQEKEASIHISNVMLVDPKSGKPTRVGIKILEDGKKVRFAKKSGEVLDTK